jgi:hypothetical protein
MSEEVTKTNGATAGVCSVCNGSGRPKEGDQFCICQGAGTHEAEVANLRQLAGSLRSEFQAVMVQLTLMGYTVTKPSHIQGAIERLFKRAVDAEDEYVKLKRIQAKTYGNEKPPSC